MIKVRVKCEINQNLQRLASICFVCVAATLTLLISSGTRESFAQGLQVYGVPQPHEAQYAPLPYGRSAQPAPNYQSPLIRQPPPTILPSQSQFRSTRQPAPLVQQARPIRQRRNQAPSSIPSAPLITPAQRNYAPAPAPANSGYRSGNGGGYSALPQATIAQAAPPVSNVRRRVFRADDLRYSLTNTSPSGKNPVFKISKQAIGSSRSLRMTENETLLMEFPTDLADVAIGNPNIVNTVIRTTRRAFLIAGQLGQTNVQFYDVKGRLLVNLTVDVAPDVDGILGHIRRQVPHSDITIESVRGNLLISGTVTSAIDAKRVADIIALFASDGVKVLSTVGVRGSQQVALKVTIAEVQTETLKRLGVNLEGLSLSNGSNTSSAKFSLLNPNSINTNSSGGASFKLDTRGIDASISALESVGLVKVLANTTLTAASGEAASFLAGGEYPIPSSVENGQVGFTYKPFGVGLNFTPIVLSRDAISLRVSTEVSEIGASISTAQDGLSLPSINTRKTETSVELPSGRSMVIAGLIRERTRQASSGLPGLRQLPIIGALFRSREFTSLQSELIIVVTPYLVQHVSPESVELPGRRFLPPTDTDIYATGKFFRYPETSNIPGTPTPTGQGNGSFPR